MNSQTEYIIPPSENGELETEIARLRTEDEFRRTLRLMAWERAKGELSVMLRTVEHDPVQGPRLREMVERFIEQVEREGVT